MLKVTQKLLLRFHTVTGGDIKTYCSSDCAIKIKKCECWGLEMMREREDKNTPNKLFVYSLTIYSFIPSQRITLVFNSCRFFKNFFYPWQPGNCLCLWETDFRLRAKVDKLSVTTHSICSTCCPIAWVKGDGHRCLSVPWFKHSPLTLGRARQLKQHSHTNHALTARC